MMPCWMPQIGKLKKKNCYYDFKMKSWRKFNVKKCFSSMKSILVYFWLITFALFFVGHTNGIKGSKFFFIFLRVQKSRFHTTTNIYTLSVSYYVVVVEILEYYPEYYISQLRVIKQNKMGILRLGKGFSRLIDSIPSPILTSHPTDQSRRKIV